MSSPPLTRLTNERAEAKALLKVILHLLQRHDIIPGSISNYSRQEPSAVAKGLSENPLFPGSLSREQGRLGAGRRMLLTDGTRRLTQPLLALLRVWARSPLTPSVCRGQGHCDDCQDLRLALAGRLAKKAGRVTKQEAGLHVWSL